MKSIIEFIEQRSMLSHSGNINEKQNFLIKGHTTKQDADYVDLDLPSGLKWATCNIGADKPEEPGLLFQWGRVNGYKYGDKKHKFLSSSDYVTTSGTKYKKGDTLKPKDDAAYQATKGRFRIPTVDEMDELLKYTDNEWTELNGVEGYKFISKKDDSKWIFIPGAGSFNASSDSFECAGYRGYMWSSSVNIDFSGSADCLYFYVGRCYHYSSNRFYGRSVRGVYK